MSQPWSEQQRQALRVLREAISVRARRETEVAAGLLERTEAVEQEYRGAKQRSDDAFALAEADALGQAEQARQQLEAAHAAAKQRAESQHAAAREEAQGRYTAAKEALEADFEETRWTLNTVYESDKKVAKDLFTEAQNTAVKSVELVESQKQAAIQLWQKLDWIDELPDPGPVEPPAKDADPWQALEECKLRAGVALDALQTIRRPTALNGVTPWIVLGAAWLLLSAPGLLLEFWYYWLAGTTLTILPAGVLFVFASRRRVRTQVVQAWEAICRAADRGALLRPVCVEKARLTYEYTKVEAKEQFRVALQRAVDETRTKLDALRQQREGELQEAKAAAKRHSAQRKQERDERRKQVEEAFVFAQAEAQARHERELQEAGERYQRARDENNRRHAQEWTELLRDWKQGCDQFVRTSRAVAKACAENFPPWEEPWRPAAALPWGLRFGEMRIRLEDFKAGVPADPQLPLPDLNGITFPALLPFPEQASLLLRAHEEGKAGAIRALQAILLRCWTSLPPGKARCTIIDPVGRGENFGAFMHLADHDESFVHGRIWTEASQVEQRLADLTVHMENVLQKYLRNQFQTLAEYNEQAGEVAEPFRFLVVADFPVNFTTDAARRLISLASAGARCGIYTFVMIDTKQPLPQGIERDDLERACTCLDWQDGVFVWEDADFGQFPLALDGLPPPERCTELLSQAGAAAKKASRVEVPFEWLMPASEAWWAGDSRGGIDVPLGRSGARGKQLLQLGRGTSQHVLVAGKTGSGKSTLLHVLITQVAMHYSPREIELYLIDFKKGVEFKAYAAHALPHARVVAVESEREFGLSVLQRLDAELSRRGELFRTHGVNDLAGYRAAAEKSNGPADLPNLPRVLLVVDEFQEFFVEDDRVAQESALLLDRLVRQGRAFGVHVLLGSQTLGGAYSLARSTIDQMAVRIALQCSEADAHLILNRDNTEARLLSRPGEAIYNASHGMLEGNHLFQVVWLGDNKRDELLARIHDLSRRRDDYLTPIVFEGTAEVSLEQSPPLARSLARGPNPGPTWHAWLGDAVAIKDPTAAVFRKQTGSNLLVVGHHEEIAVGLTTAAVVSLGAQVGPRETLAPINLVAATALEPSAEAVLAVVTESLLVRQTSPRDLPTLLSELTDELNRRLAGAAGEGPLFLVLHGLHRLRDLRKADDDFGFSSRKEEKPSPQKLLVQLLKEGPPVGIFTLIWCDTYTNVQRVFDRQTMREFDMRVLLQMSVSDSSSLTDSPLAAKLGPRRAFLYTEDQGKLEKFRPYSLPSPAWLRSLRGHRGGNGAPVAAGGETEASPVGR